MMHKDREIIKDKLRKHKPLEDKEMDYVLSVMQYVDDLNESSSPDKFL